MEELRERVRAAPGDYVAQRLVELSTHPTVVDGSSRRAMSTCDRSC